MKKTILLIPVFILLSSIVFAGINGSCDFDPVTPYSIISQFNEGDTAEPFNSDYPSIAWSSPQGAISILNNKLQVVGAGATSAQLGGMDAYLADDGAVLEFEFNLSVSAVDNNIWFRADDDGVVLRIEFEADNDIVTNNGDTGVNYNDNEWYRIRVDFNDSNQTYRVYLNDSIIADGEGYQTADNVDRLFFRGNDAGVSIAVDNIYFINGTEGCPAPPPPADTTPPTLTIIHPTNNTWSINYTIGGTSSDATAVDNTTINDSRWENIGTAEAFDFINITLIPDGNYTINITSNDTEGNQISKVISFGIDATPPNWTIKTFELDNSSSFLIATHNITLNDSVYDFSLVNATINITNSSQVMYNKTLIASGNKTLNFTEEIDISNWQNGRFNVTYEGVDIVGNHVNISYSFSVISNTAPAISGINLSYNTIIKQGEQNLTISVIDDLDGDSLSFYCCKDETDICIPSTTNNDLDDGIKENVASPYDTMWASYDVGIEPFDEFIRCRAYDGELYSNTISDSYNIISSASNPIIYEEYFRYSDDVEDNGWFKVPFNESIAPVNNSLYLDQYKFISLTKYITRTKIPMATIEFNLNISGTDPVGFGVYRWDEDEPYKLIPETILSLTFANQIIYHRNASIGSYNASGLHNYELNLYFKAKKSYYNNITKAVEILGNNKFILKQDDVPIKYNNHFNTNTTIYDDYFFDRLVFYKTADANITLDTILVYEGDDLIYNNIFEIIDPTNKSGYMTEFGGFIETNSWDFQCNKYPKCCEWITRSNGTRVQVASKTWCIYGSVAKEWFYGAGDKKGLVAWVFGNLFEFIFLLVVIVIGLTTIYALRRKKNNEN